MKKDKLLTTPLGLSSAEINFQEEVEDVMYGLPQSYSITLLTVNTQKRGLMALPGSDTLYTC